MNYCLLFHLHHLYCFNIKVIFDNFFSLQFSCSTVNLIRGGERLLKSIIYCNNGLDTSSLPMKNALRVQQSSSQWLDSCELLQLHLYSASFIQEGRYSFLWLNLGYKSQGETVC